LGENHVSLDFRVVGDGSDLGHRQVT
jgi:hypothetical protein